MKWLRQLNCNHEYFKVGVDTDLSSYGTWEYYTTLYCPKCGKTEQHSQSQAEILLKCQEIKKEFNKSV